MIDSKSDSIRRYLMKELVIQFSELVGYLKEISSQPDNREQIHKSRVTSRRIRATLDFYPEFQDYKKDIKKITKYLGDIRDIDVQIELVDGMDNNFDHSKKIDLIKSWFMDQRKVTNQILLDEVPNFLETVTSIDSRLRNKSPEDHKNDSFLVWLESREAVKDLLENMLNYEDSIRDPSDNLKHHKMRIAAKNLRYTLEIFSELNPEIFQKVINSLVTIQDVLGNIHDIDVLNQKIKGEIRNQKDCNQYNSLISRLLISRNEKFQTISNSWDNIKKDIREGVEEIITLSSRRSEIINRVKKVRGKYEYNSRHPDQVSKLSISLFDQMNTNLNYDNEDRLYLEIAALLHDIGWSMSGKHNENSRYLILNDNEFPFNEYEKRIIGTIARYHNKGSPDNTDTLFSSLAINDQQKILKLSSLLRVSDGLDNSHRSVVKDIKVIYGEESTTLICFTERSHSIEDQDLVKKKRLFESVYGKKVKIKWVKE